MPLDRALAGYDPFADDQVRTAPQVWRWPDLSAMSGLRSAMEQSAAIDAAHPWQPGMTAGQMLAGRPEDPLASAFIGGPITYHAPV